jgi:hypothetical protein
MNAQKRAELLSLIILAGFVVAVALAYVYGFYKESPYPYSTFLFSPNDNFTGQLDAANSLGVHRFGDLHAVWFAAGSSDPYFLGGATPGLSRASYFPFTYVLFKPLSWLPYPAALVLFLVTTTSATFVAFWQRIGGQDNIQRGLLTLMIAGLTYPMLFNQDRGNIDIVIFLVLWMMLEMMLRARWQTAALLLALAASFKGLPVLLALLFIPVRKWKAAATAAVAAIGLTLISFATMSGGLAHSIEGFRSSLESFGVFVNLGTTSLQHNTSITGLLAVLAHWSPFFTGAFDSAGVISALVLIVAVTASLALPLLLWERVTLIVIAMTLVPAVSFDYRLLLLLLPAGLVISDRTSSDVPAYIVILFGLLLIPKALPVLWADIGAGTLINPILMLILLAAVIVRGIQRRRQCGASAWPGEPLTI